MIVTDRKDLDNQLHGTFVDTGAVQPRGRRPGRHAAHLRGLLAPTTAMSSR